MYLRKHRTCLRLWEGLSSSLPAICWSWQYNLPLCSKGRGSLFGFWFHRVIYWWFTRGTDGEPWESLYRRSFSKWQGLTLGWRKLKWYDFGRRAGSNEAENGLLVLSVLPEPWNNDPSLFINVYLVNHNTSEMSLAFRRRTIDLVCALPHQRAVTGLHPNWGN